MNKRSIIEQYRLKRNEKQKRINLLNELKMYADLRRKLSVRYPLKPVYHTMIPLNIFQTWHTKQLTPLMNQCVSMIKRNNPRFHYYLFDDHDCREFIKNHFDLDVLNAYDTLIPGAYKADLWRYCILYVNGGIYLDIKYRCINGFRLIALTEQEWFVKDIETSGEGVYNALMVAKPNNPIYLKLINKVVENVKNRFYGNHSLEPTGPLMIKEFSDSNDFSPVSLVHFISNDHYYILDQTSNVFILQIDNEYRGQQKIHTNNKKHYSVMWKNREIYTSDVNNIKN
jgi:mannosyltransferase OCH1-like enzyme